MRPSKRIDLKRILCWVLVLVPLVLIIALFIAIIIVSHGFRVFAGAALLMASICLGGHLLGWEDY